MKRPSNLTEYQQAVYDCVSTIPKGCVTTYGSLAQAMDRGSARSAGQALRVNPFAPRVPCHRVVRSDGRLGGFSGQTEGPEVARKRTLLQNEGVRFTDADHVHPDCLWTPPMSQPS